MSLAILQSFLPLPSTLGVFWAGTSVAIANEAKAKFNAKSLERRVAFDVGTHVFQAQTKLEYGIFAMMLLSKFGCGNPGDLKMLGLATSAFFLREAFIAPLLYDRAQTIMEGKDLKNDPKYHIMYIGMDIIKIIALMKI